MIVVQSSIAAALLAAVAFPFRFPRTKGEL